MADEIDNGNETAEFFLTLALRNQQSKVVSTPKGIGMCLSCEADLDDDRRWCNADCRDDYERAQAGDQSNKAIDEDD